MKILFLNILICFFFLSGIRAQNRPVAFLTGVLYSEGGVPVAEAQVILPGSKQLVVTGSDGGFVFSHVPFGQQRMIIRRPDVADLSYKIFVDSSYVAIGRLTLGTRRLIMAGSPSVVDSIQRPAGYETQQPFPSPLPAIPDLFDKLRRPITPQLPFRRRGFRTEELYIDGWPAAMSGFPAAQGLRTAIRNAQPILERRPGMGAVDFGFTGISGGRLANIDAKHQSRHTLVGYRLANGHFRQAVTFNHASGQVGRGWYFNLAATRKWAEEGYIPGTFYEEYSYYLGVSKVWNEHSNFNLNFFGTWHRAGGTRAVTREVTQLTETVYYNPCWGFQNGEKRNAQVRQYFQPALLLHYEYTPDPFTVLTLSMGISGGSNGISALQWYHAQDPRPDYYKNLPQYYLHPDHNNPNIAEAIRQQWQKEEVRQINWKRLYAVNRASPAGVNGIPGRRSWYVLGEDHQDQLQYGLTATLKKQIGAKLHFCSGLTLQHAFARRYRKMLDLLGGDYYVNVNQFAERSYQNRPDLKQNDLRHPNELIREGDKFDYYYLATWLRMSAWSQMVVNYASFSFFLSGQLQWQQFKRTGRYQNGLFPEVSYGSSAPQRFPTYGLRGGMLYKISGRHYLFINGLIQTIPPAFQNTFIAPRYRNTITEHPRAAHVSAMEAGYALRHPRIFGQLAIFTADLRDQTRVLRFYHERYRSFVNYVMQGIAQRHLGLECVVSVSLSPTFSLQGGASWMQVFYTSRPNITVYQDNDTSVAIDHQQVYWKNYYATPSPQSVYTLGIRYRKPPNWMAGINVNYCDRAYESVNPIRLTKTAVGLLPPDAPKRARILRQQRLPASFFINLQIGGQLPIPERLRWPGTPTLHWHLSVDNVLNNKKIIATAYQQLRFDDRYREPAFFPAKYRYAPGRIVSLKLLFRF